MRATVREVLLAKGYSLRESEALVMAGQVFLNSAPVDSLNQIITDSLQLTIKATKEYVSRGAYKLLAAIQEFGLNFNNKIVLDIGSSTGGFTQVVLEHGASKVFALDSGTNQLDYSLRINSRVVVMEKTNLKLITHEMFNPLPEIVVCDVAFISLKNVFRVLQNFNVQIIALIKPQFEANSNQVETGGFVSEKLHPAIITKVAQYAQDSGFQLKKIVKSPIVGNVAKNVEYIAFFEKI